VLFLKENFLVSKILKVCKNLQKTNIKITVFELNKEAMERFKVMSILNNKRIIALDW